MKDIKYIRWINMEKAKMERISFLSRKQRSEGLTELEKQEQAILRKEYRQGLYTLTPAGEDVYNRYKDAEGFQQMAEVAVLAAKRAGKTDADAVDRAIDDITRILEEFDIETRAYIISQV